MTDVRLTALNPEDSQVYPVACNSSGELLVDKGETVEYVKVSGDNMTGDLTLGNGTDDKITLNATAGGATFAGSKFRVEATGDVKADGFIRTGGTAMNGVADGVYLNNDGAVYASRGPNETLWAGYTTGLAADTSRIKSDGSASFAGDVKADGARFIAERPAGQETIGLFDGLLDGVNTVSIKANGSATFSGDVVVGSRSKQWMLVEQGGLCHMVQQVRASTPDLVDPAAAAEYPKLRDVFAELNVIEKALEEVMEKLRMTAPNGWPVWDGSDNSR